MKNVIQTYLQGSRHKANNQPCEDRTYSLALNDVQAIALADGAGSQKYPNAAIGAECVTREICRFFCDKFDQLYETDDLATINRAIMVRCQNALNNKAEELGLEGISTMASTLLAVAIKGDKAIYCHIGDGAIGAVTDDSIKVISAPENGEFASTTYFITLPNAEQFIRYGKIDVTDISIFFLMSDGTCDYSFDDSEGVFLDGAAKLALLAYDRLGEIKLTQIVQKHLIEPDSTSDDCSFVAMRIREQKPKMFVAQEVANPQIEQESVDQAKADALEIDEALKMFSASPHRSDRERQHSVEQPVLSAPAPSVRAPEPLPEKSNNKKLGIIIGVLAVVIIAIVVAIILVFAKPAADKDASTTESSVTQSVTESTTSAEQNTMATNPAVSSVDGIGDITIPGQSTSAYSSTTKATTTTQNTTTTSQASDASVSSLQPQQEDTGAEGGASI